MFSAINGLEFDTDHVRGLTDRLKRYSNGDRRLITNSRSEARQAAAQRTYRAPTTVARPDEHSFEADPVDDEATDAAEAHAAAAEGAANWAANPEQTFQQAPIPTENAIARAKRLREEAAAKAAGQSKTPEVKLPPRKSLEG